VKYAAVFFGIFIVGVVILADRGQLGPLKAIYDFPYGDKVGHVVLFGLLNFFLTMALLFALPRRKPMRVAIAIGILLAVVIGVEEYSQNSFRIIVLSICWI
jgi:polysaccharide biosynthesis protein VpsQ